MTEKVKLNVGTLFTVASLGGLYSVKCDFEFDVYNEDMEYYIEHLVNNQTIQEIPITVF